MYQTILAIGLLIFFAHLFTSIFKKTKIPDVLLLMIVGIVVGPVLNLVKIEFFGGFGTVVTKIALIIILFDGGTHLSIESLKKAFSNTIILTLTMFITTFAIVSFTMYEFFSMNLMTSLMIGAMAAPISPAVVLPMINALDMPEKPHTILILETAFTDVLGIILAYSFIEAVRVGNIEVSQMFTNVFISSFGALVIGLISGVIWAQFLKKIRQFPNTIFTTFAFVFILYGLTELVNFSGPLAVLAFGFAISNLKSILRSNWRWLNSKDIRIEDGQFEAHEHNFFGEIQFLLKIFFFVYLGISFPLKETEFLIIGFVISAVLFIVRILIVRFTVARSLDTRSSSIISIMIPKGLASAVLAAIPMQYGLENGEFIGNIIDTIILWTIVFSSLFIILIEKTAFKHMIITLLGLNAKKLEEELDNDSIHIEMEKDIESRSTTIDKEDDMHKGNKAF